MICPKCGFNQPADIYCALCGVHVKKYRRQRKKKFAFVVSLLMFMAAAALLASRLSPVRDGRFAPAPAPFKTAAPKPGASTPKTPPAAGNADQKEHASFLLPEPLAVSKSQSFAPATYAEKQGAHRTPVEKEIPLSASQWFDEGRALNDDSIEEIFRYQKALELDPAFAPAYFHLGGIYFRKAEYGLADQAFAQFLKFATDEQKAIYDIYVFYSPREVETLVAEEEEQTDSAVAAKKKESDQEKPGSDTLEGDGEAPYSPSTR